MSAISVSGKSLAKEVRASLADQVKQIEPKLGRKPGLAVVLVGEDPASKVYVKAKTKAALSCGIEVSDHFLPADISDAELQNKLKELSADSAVDGILLQLPLPKGLDEFSALCAIAPEKDADGLHPTNQGLLLRGADTFEPCTPKGCMTLIDKARSELGQDNKLDGLHAVVVGRSILVGKPVGLMLLERNCTVTYCHSRTRNLAEEVRKADIVIAAVGRAEMIKAEHVKPGAIVIDVGINRLDDGRLVGDVDYASVAEVSSAITPVPGGVGPMTIAMLLANTVKSAAKKL